MDCNNDEGRDNDSGMKTNTIGLGLCVILLRSLFTLYLCDPSHTDGGAVSSSKAQDGHLQ